MALFRVFTKMNINEGVKAFQKNTGSFLLDVRTEAEYARGHIAGSKNVPLQTLEAVAEVVYNKTALLYVYCQSGVRSAKAVEQLRKMGYSNVIDIGGIQNYNGETVKW